MTRAATKEKPCSQGSAGGGVGNGAGVARSGYTDALELCVEILQRSENGEFYLPDDLTERIREL